MKKNTGSTNKKWLLIATLLVIIGVGAGIAMAQRKHQKAAAEGPYRAFLTKPLVALGWKAGHLYREHEMVGAALNDLHAKGFKPIWTEIMTQKNADQQTERLLVICRQR